MTHSLVGEALLKAAEYTLGQLPLKCHTLTIDAQSDVEQLEEKIGNLVEALGPNKKLLVLTDLYGATPCNLINAIGSQHVEVVTGVNLPMLIKIMNYPNLHLDDLAQVAVSGGRNSIINCQNRCHDQKEINHH